MAFARAMGSRTDEAVRFARRQTIPIEGKLDGDGWRDAVEVSSLKLSGSLAGACVQPHLKCGCLVACRVGMTNCGAPQAANSPVIIRST